MIEAENVTPTGHSTGVKSRPLFITSPRTQVEGPGLTQPSSRSWLKSWSRYLYGTPDTGEKAWFLYSYLCMSVIHFTRRYCDRLCLLVSYLCRRWLCLYFGLFVCLSVRRITEKVVTCKRILTKFLGVVGHGPGTKWLNFGDDPLHSPDPGVQSPKSGYTGLSKSYKRILMKFYGELGCGLETNWLHFGDDPHHYPDPRVHSGSRS